MPPVLPMGPSVHTRRPPVLWVALEALSSGGPMGMHWNHYRYALEAPWVCTGGLWLYSTGGPMGMGWRLNGIIVLQSVWVGPRPYG